MKETILIGGGTGMIGSKIIERLPSEKYNIKILTRDPKSPKDHISYHKWDIDDMHIEPGVIDDVDYIINLTGAGIADKRWTKERKKVLIDSRVNSTKLLCTAIEASNTTPKAYISASAIGFYGDRDDEKLYEYSEPGKGFLADCCVLWEGAVLDVQPLVGREVRLRIGIVLSMQGGALPKILMTKDLGLFNYFGDGSQYNSWIHIDDLADMFIAAIENSKMEGAYNAVAPKPLTNKEFTKQVRDGVGSSGMVLPAPRFAIRALLGEMADVVLNSTRVIPSRFEELKYNYKYTDLKKAIDDIVNG